MFSTTYLRILFAMIVSFFALIGCRDAVFDIEKPNVDVDTDIGDDQDNDTENGGDDDDTNGDDDDDDDDNGDDDDDDDDPSQNDCFTTDLGNFISDEVVLGRRFKKTCPGKFEKIFVVENDGDKKTLLFTKFQNVTIGGVAVTCPKYIKRWNILGELLEKQVFDKQCNVISKS